jgi:rubrerythrin
LWEEESVLRAEDSVVKLIQRQKQSEESMVKAVEVLEGRVQNEAAKLLLAELRLDSTKHAQICSEILKTVDKAEPVNLWDARIGGYVDMQVVRKELERHIKLEEAMLKDVERIINESKDEAIKLLFTHIAEDERKHHKNIQLIIKRSYTLVP